MHPHDRRNQLLARAAAPLALSLLTLVGCTGSDSTPGALSQSQIQDYDHGSQLPGFWFLEPFVDVDGKLVFHTFNDKANPTVTIDEVDVTGKLVRAGLATFTVKGGPRYKNGNGQWIDEHVRIHQKDGRCDEDDDDGDDDRQAYYYVRVDADDLSFVDGKYYRVRVTAPIGALGTTRTLGFADIEVHKNQKQLNKVDTDNFVPLKAGHGIRIKFRIDTDATAPCYDQPCQHGGVCADSNDKTTFTCDCAGTGYQGATCGTAVCAPVAPNVCNNDLSGTLGGDFRMQFKLKTSQNTGVVSLFSQRPECSAAEGSGGWWDVRLTEGKLTVETGGDHYDLNYSKTLLGDGKEHVIVVERKSGVLTITIDCVLDATGASTAILGDLSGWPYTTTDVCIGHDTTVPLVGSLTVDCISH